jgi:ElaB/YqjD/DUF883 family membrane-anchored ribosome-binding protein
MAFTDVEVPMADKNVQDELQTLKDDIAKLRTDVSQLVDVLKDLGVEKVDSARASVEEEIQAQRERVRDAIGKAKDRGKKTADDIEDHITEHPLSSLLAAFGLGFIIAKLSGGGSESSR